MTKFNFKKMSKQDNIELIKWAFLDTNGSLDIYRYTITYFPELSKVDRNNKKRVYEVIDEVVGEYYDTNEKVIDKEIDRYNKIWSKYSDLYLETLNKYFNVNYEVKSILIEIGFIPVFPRYLDTLSMALAVNLKENKIVESIAHEVLHFWWFYKWILLYPNCNRKEFEAPSKIWQYSEMVVDPILNSKEIQMVFKEKFKEKAYDSFYKLEYKGRKVMDELNKIYQENISIEEKIEKGYELIKIFIK